MAAIEFEGKDLEEAIAKAAEALSLPPEKVKFTLITMGGKGFLGFGRRKARINVNPDDPKLVTEDDQPKSAAPQKSAANRAAEPAASAPGGMKSAPQSRRDNAPPQVKGDSAAASGHKPERHSSAKDHTENKKQAVEALPIDFSHVPPPLTKPARGESLGPADETALAAADILKNIIKLMGFEAEVKAGRVGPRVLLTIDGRDKAVLIGSHGATLEALQLMTGKIMVKNMKTAGLESENGFRVLVDMDDYRLRRQETVLENLKKAAEDARRYKRPQQVGGLNSAERRLAQLAFRPYKDLTIIGTGGRETLTIAPAGQPARPRRAPGAEGRGKSAFRRHRPKQGGGQASE